MSEYGVEFQTKSGAPALFTPKYDPVVGKNPFCAMVVSCLYVHDDPAAVLEAVGCIHVCVNDVVATVTCHVVLVSVNVRLNRLGGYLIE
jgi:hypothetical protein